MIIIIIIIITSNRAKMVRWRDLEHEWRNLE